MVPNKNRVPLWLAKIKFCFFYYHKCLYFINIWKLSASECNPTNDPSLSRVCYTTTEKRAKQKVYIWFSAESARIKCASCFQSRLLAKCSDSLFFFFLHYLIQTYIFSYRIVCHISIRNELWVNCVKSSLVWLNQPHRSDRVVNEQSEIKKCAVRGERLPKLCNSCSRKQKRQTDWTDRLEKESKVRPDRTQVWMDMKRGHKFSKWNRLGRIALGG